MFGLGPQELLFIVVLVLLLFGGSRLIRNLPQIGRNLGEGIREMKKAGKAFNDEIEEGRRDVEDSIPAPRRE